MLVLLVAGCGRPDVAAPPNDAGTVATPAVGDETPRAAVHGDDRAAPTRAAVRRMYDGYRASAFAGVPDVDASAARQRIATGEVVLVDCREPAEQAVSMIAGAVPRADFDADSEAYRGRTVVVYCTIGYRSGVYAGELREAGVDAINLIGGVLGWSHIGGSFVDESGGETRRVHVYGATWDLLAEGYESVY